MPYRRSVWDGVLIAVLAVAACIMLLPYAWMVLSSLKSNMEIVSANSGFLPGRSAWTVIGRSSAMRHLDSGCSTVW